MYLYSSIIERRSLAVLMSSSDELSICFAAATVPSLIKNIAQMSLKRERAGEWEVRRPRFTLGAKFILCGDKICFRGHSCCRGHAIVLICLYRCQLLSKLLAGCLCIIVRRILADNTLAAYHCSSGCCHSLYPVAHPLAIAPSV